MIRNHTTDEDDAAQGNTAVNNWCAVSTRTTVDSVIVAEQMTDYGDNEFRSKSASTFRILSLI